MVGVVQNDQGSLRLEGVPQLGIGRLERRLTLVERIVDRLQEIARELIPGGEVDDPVRELPGRVLIYESPHQSGLAQARLAQKVQAHPIPEGALSGRDLVVSAD